MELNHHLSALETERPTRWTNGAVPGGSDPTRPAEDLHLHLGPDRAAPYSLSERGSSPMSPLCPRQGPVEELHPHLGLSKPTSYSLDERGKYASYTISTRLPHSCANYSPGITATAPLAVMYTT